ncbi:hypothetical protein D3C84_801380 [compost metagenome]
MGDGAALLGGHALDSGAAGAVGQRRQGFAEIEADDRIEQVEVQRLSQQEVGMIADVTVIHLDQPRPAIGQHEFGMATAEADAQGRQPFQNARFDLRAGIASEALTQLDKCRWFRKERLEATHDLQCAAIAERLQGVQWACQVLLEQQGLAGVAPPVILAGIRQFLGAARQTHILAGDAGYWLDDAGQGNVGKLLR